MPHITNFDELVALLSAIPGLPVDVIDRIARELGKVQLTDYTNDGIVYPDGSIPMSPAKVTMAPFDDLANVAAVGSAAIVGLNVDHRGDGAFSTDWNKTAGAVLGGVAYTPDTPIDISKYSTHAKVMAFMYIPTPVGGTITNLYIALGTDAANLFYWEIPLTDIVYDAWHHYHQIMSEVNGVLGNGADLSAIQHIGIYVQTSVAGATLTNILVDEVVVKRSSEVLINQLEGEPLITEDTGVHTNPRAYEKDNGFVSNPIAVVGPAATLLWAVGTPCVRNPSDVPANGRTAGNITTVYTMEIRNPDAAVQTAWLETTGAVIVSVVYELAANETIIIDFIAGKTFGNMDLYINGSIVDIECQLEGTEV